MKLYNAIFAISCLLLLQFFNFARTQLSTPPVLTTSLAANFALRTGIDLNELQESKHRIVKGAEQFALDFLKQMSDAHVRNPTKSYMVSPFAVWSLLLLLAEGADGKTLDELRRTLHIDSDPLAIRMAYQQISQLLQVNTTTIEVASFQALFTDINKPVNRDYENLVTRYYESALIAVNFSDVNNTFTKINDDIKRATRGLIPSSVLPQDFKDAALLMISSLYFKGKWKYPFEADLTRVEPFYDEHGAVMGNVEMMTTTGLFNYVNMRNLGCYVLELPYGKEDRLSMLIFLPIKTVSLNEVIGHLRDVGIRPIIQQLNAVALEMEDEDIKDQVEVFLPKFTTTSHFTLRPILTTMGLHDIFEPQLANLDKMAKNTFVGSIFQSTRIIVNEEGTEAAAVTTAVLVNKASPTKFYVDRPFAYVIVEKVSGLLLFAGEVKSHKSN